MDGYRSTRSGLRNQVKQSNFSQASSNSSNVSQNNLKSSTFSQSQTKSSHSRTSKSTSKLTSNSETPSSTTSVGVKTNVKDSSLDSVKSRPRRSKSVKKDDEKTVKNPELIQTDKPVDNEDLINGLSLQRQWDEKPDIDHLSNSLLNLYQKLDFNPVSSRSSGTKPTLDKDSLSNSNSINELRAKIFLSSIRVKSKSINYVNYVCNKLMNIIKYTRHMNYRFNVINTNINKIEKYFLKLCKHYQRNKSLNEVYERLSKIVNKLPDSTQVEITSNELKDRKAKTLEKIDKIKDQIQLQKSQINDIIQLLTNLTSK